MRPIRGIRNSRFPVFSNVSDSSIKPSVSASSPFRKQTFRRAVGRQPTENFLVTKLKIGNVCQYISQYMFIV